VRRTAQHSMEDVFNSPAVAVSLKAKQ